MPTNAERMRAKRIRAKGPSGMDGDDRSWLAAYEREITRAGRRKRAPASPLSPVGDPPPQTPALTPAPALAPDGHTVIDFGAPAGSAPSPTPAPSVAIPSPGAPAATHGPCKIKDCPACQNVRGAQICATTQKKIWPPMSLKSSEAMAKTILWIIGMAVKLFRKDKQYVEPTEREIAAFAEGLREFSYRRASWVGAFDDLFLIGQGLAGYTRRAIMAPDLVREPVTVAEQVAVAEAAQ